jgi:hypothetical protein
MNTWTSEWAWVPFDARPSSMGDADVRRTDGAADHGRPGGRVGVLGTAHAELDDRSPVGGLDHPGGLGGDEGLEVDVVQQPGLEDLGHHQRSLDHRDRGVGVDDPTLRHRPQVDVDEPAHLVEVAEEVLGEELPPVAVRRLRRTSSSAGPNRAASIQSSIGASPAAMQYPAWCLP